MGLPRYISILGILLLLSACDKNPGTDSLGANRESQSHRQPKNLAEAVADLDRMIPIDWREAYRTMEGTEPFSDSSMAAPKSFALQMRNGWWLWKDSELSRYFAVRGLEHPDWAWSAIWAAWLSEVRTGEFDEDSIVSTYAAIEQEWRRSQKNSSQATPSDGRPPVLPKK